MWRWIHVYNIDHLGTSSISECQTACKQTEDCNFFTFDDADNFCALYYNCSSIDDTTCTDCYTGQKDCLICSQAGECQGIDVGGAFTSTVEDCERECYDNAECQWYTYDLTFEYCFLTSDCTPRTPSSPNVFGQKECYQENGAANQSKI